MAIYNPPSFIEELSTFNPINWEESIRDIDTAYLNAHYLKYPVAQGEENLVDTNVNGTLTVSGALVIGGGIDISGNVGVGGNADVSGNLTVDDYLIFGDGSKTETASNTVVVNLSGQLTYTLSASLIGKTITFTNSALNQIVNLVDANTADAHSSSTKIYNNGGYPMTIQTGSNFRGNFGTNSYSFVLYAGSWVELVSNYNGNAWLIQDKSPNSTYYFNVGGDAILDLNTFRYPLNGTIVAYGVGYGTINLPLIYAQYQYSLRIISATGQQISINCYTGDNFAGPCIGVDNTISTYYLQQNDLIEMYASGGDWYISNRAPYAEQLNIYPTTGVVMDLLTTFKSSYFNYYNIVGNDVATYIRLPPNTTSIRNGGLIEIYNSGFSNQLIRTYDVDVNFGIFGPYGSNSGSAYSPYYTLPPNCYAKFQYTYDDFNVISNWACIARSPEFYPYTFNLTTNNMNLYDYIFPIAFYNVSITSNASYTFYLPLSGDVVSEAPINLQNNSVYDLTVSLLSPNQFKGKYGSNTATIRLPAKTSINLTQTANGYNVNSREGHFAIDLTANTNNNFTTNYSILDGHIRFTTGFTGTYNFTLPNPTIAHNAELDIYNNGSYPQTLTTPSGVFSQNLGSGQTTYTLPAQTQVHLYSNGTNWNVIDAGPNGSYFSISLSADTNYSSFPISVNSLVKVSPTGNFALTLPNPTTTTSINSRFRILNTSTDYYITLTLNSPFTFEGYYGSGAQTLLLPADCYLDVYSDNTNSYVCYNALESAWVYPFRSIGSITIDRPVYNQYLVATSSSNATFSFASALYNNSIYRGKIINVRKTGGRWGSGLFVSASMSAPVSRAESSAYSIQSFSPYNSLINFKITQLGIRSSSAGGSAFTVAGNPMIYIDTANPTGAITFNSQITLGGTQYTVKAIGATYPTCNYTSGNLTMTVGGTAVNGDIFAGATLVGFAGTGTGQQTSRITNVSGTFPNYTLTLDSAMAFSWTNQNTVVGWGGTMTGNGTTTATIAKTASGSPTNIGNWITAGHYIVNASTTSTSYLVVSVSSQTNTSATVVLSANLSAGTVNIIVPIYTDGFVGSVLVSPTPSASLTNQTFTIDNDYCQPVIIGGQS